MSAETKAAIATRGVAEGALPRAALHCSRVPGGDDGWFNVTRLAIDASDPFALSEGEREGRRQALAAARFIAANVPGCAKARLVSFAPQLGIRETRRIAGLATLTADDLRSGAEFVDTMALGAYPIDVHHTGDANITFEELGPDHVYALPYRIAVPQGLDNALVAGRGLSATPRSARRHPRHADGDGGGAGRRHRGGTAGGVQPAGSPARSGDLAREAQGRRRDPLTGAQPLPGLLSCLTSGRRRYFFVMPQKAVTGGGTGGSR